MPSREKTTPGKAMLQIKERSDSGRQGAERQSVDSIIEDKGQHCGKDNNTKNNHHFFTHSTASRERWKRLRNGHLTSAAFGSESRSQQRWRRKVKQANGTARRCVGTKRPSQQGLQCNGEARWRRKIGIPHFAPSADQQGSSQEGEGNHEVRAEEGESTSAEKMASAHSSEKRDNNATGGCTPGATDTVGITDSNSEPDPLYSSTLPSTRPGAYQVPGDAEREAAHRDSSGSGRVQEDNRTQQSRQISSRYDNNNRCEIDTMTGDEEMPAITCDAKLAPQEKHTLCNKERIWSALLQETPVIEPDSVVNFKTDGDSKQIGISNHEEQCILLGVKKHVTCALLCLVAAFIVVAVVVVPLAMNSQNSSSSGPSYPLRYDAIKQTLHDIVLNHGLNGSAFLDQLEDISSTQHKALLWLVDKDTCQVHWHNKRSLVQRFVLSTLYFATSGERWSEDCKFLAGEHECGWNADAHWNVTDRMKGAYCLGNNSTIDFIGIGGNNLNGVLPDEIGLLDDLILMDFSSNLLSKSVPTTLGSLKQLRHLNISDNKFDGPIPTSIGQLTNLTELILFGNQLSGTIPTELNALHKLGNLNLFRNNLNGTLPFTTSSFPNIQDLILGENSFTGPLPRAVFTFRNLRHLLLQDNRLSGTIPTEIGNLANLRVLEAWTNKIEGTLPTEIEKLSMLSWLDFADNLFVGTVPGVLSKLQLLKVLWLGWNKFSGTLPKYFGKLTELVELDLRVNNLVGTVPDVFGGMTKLKWLRLDVNGFYGSLPQSAAGLENLATFTISNTSLTGNMQLFCKNVEGLSKKNKTHLYIADCYMYDNFSEVTCDCCSACCKDDEVVSGCVIE